MAFKNKVTKYYINKEIEFIMFKLFYIKQLYFIYRKTAFTDGYKNICERLPEISNFILPAIFDKILLELNCLVNDRGDKDLSICNFIYKYHKNSQLFKEQYYIYIKPIGSDKKRRFYIDTNSIKEDIINLEKCIRSNNKINKYIKKQRHKIIAHNDWKINFKTNFKYKELKKKILYEELEQYIDDLLKSMNTIYSTLFKSKFMYCHNVDSELNYLDYILQNDKNTGQTIIKKECNKHDK